MRKWLIALLVSMIVCCGFRIYFGDPWGGVVMIFTAILGVFIIRDDMDITYCSIFGMFCAMNCMFDMILVLERTFQKYWFYCDAIIEERGISKKYQSSSWNILSSTNRISAFAPPALLTQVDCSAESEAWSFFGSAIVGSSRRLVIMGVVRSQNFESITLHANNVVLKSHFVFGLKMVFKTELTRYRDNEFEDGQLLWAPAFENEYDSIESGRSRRPYERPFAAYQGKAYKLGEEEEKPLAPGDIEYYTPRSDEQTKPLALGGIEYVIGNWGFALLRMQIIQI
jgi:hypothetical protein